MGRMLAMESLDFVLFHSLVLTIVTCVEFECFQYSDHLTDKAMYRLKERGLWKNLTCRPGTKWNRNGCYCATDWTEEEAHDPQHTHCDNFQTVAGEPSQYKQKNPTNNSWETKDCRDFDEKLSWNQTVCQCVQHQETINVDPDSTACDTMFDYCFDTDTVSSKYYIKKTNKQKTQTVEDVDAYNGKAVFLNQAPLLVPIFLNNELGVSFQIYVRFKLEATNREDLKDKYQVIFSSKGENHTATISCSYKPSTYTYRLLLQNETQPAPVIQECFYEAGDKFTSWKSIYILYQDGEVIMAVNGKPCLQFEFTGYPKFKCPLAIGGYPSTYDDGRTSDESIMLGYIDVMSVDRNCRSPIP
ncbi:uncharacterized protein LOC135471637 [Liolophura sinensis]|uniref:uncharacterized protein LOC135471637 n=1 Tax=Liolophura sinensis TaxID=3198878 RepID=UPI00315905C0